MGRTEKLEIGLLRWNVLFGLWNLCELQNLGRSLEYALRNYRERSCRRHFGILEFFRHEFLNFPIKQDLNAIGRMMVQRIVSICLNPPL